MAQSPPHTRNVLGVTIYYTRHRTTRPWYTDSSKRLGRAGGGRPPPTMGEHIWSTRLFWEIWYQNTFFPPLRLALLGAAGDEYNTATIILVGVEGP